MQAPAMGTHIAQVDNAARVDGARAAGWYASAMPARRPSATPTRASSIRANPTRATTARANPPATPPRRTGARSANAALLAWLREHAQPFDPARGPGAAQLAMLNPHLQDARVLLLGESAPAARQVVTLRLALLRHTLARGFAVLGMPGAPSTTMRVQRWLAAGKAGAMPTSNLPAAGAERLFLAALRRSTRLRTGLQLFGTALGPALGKEGDDAQGRADAHLELDALLDLPPAPNPAPGHAPEGTNALRRVADLRRLLAPLPGEATADAAERLAWALDWMDMQFAPLTDALGSAGYARLRNLIEWLQASCAGAAPDDIMQAQLAFALAERWPESRAVLYGPCAAMLRDDALAEVVRPGRGQAGDTSQAQARSAGDFIARTLLPQHAQSRRTAVAWCVHGGGLRARGSARAAAAQRLPAHSLNARLAGLGSAFVLSLRALDEHALDDPRAAPLREPQLVVAADGTRITLHLQSQLDVLCFLPTADDCA